MITKQQLYEAFCLICPHRYPTGSKNRPCKKQNAECGGDHKDIYLKRVRYLKQATNIAHWIHDDENEFSHYFKIKE